MRPKACALSYMRVRAFPFCEDVERFLAAHRLLFVVEQNRDAQFRSLLTLETKVDKAKLRSLLHYDGLPISSALHRQWRARRSAAAAASRRRRSGAAGRRST